MNIIQTPIAGKSHHRSHLTKDSREEHNTTDIRRKSNYVRRWPRAIVPAISSARRASLLEHRLIDELNLFVNPIAIGNGLEVFNGRTPLSLVSSTAYPCGIVVSTYRPA